MTAAKSIRGQLEVLHSPVRRAYEGAALDELETAVRAYFDEHQPDPASFPAIASQVIDLVEHPDVDVARLAHLIEREPAICTAVLAVANSAANRRTATVQNVRTAVNLLGLKRVANVAAGVACRSLFDVEAKVEHDLFPDWWSRLFFAAMTDAFAAAFVAMQHQRQASESIFLSGLLHDLGKSVALRSLAGLLISGKLTDIPNDDTIEELLGRTRAAVGAAALARFNLPQNLVELCARQDEEGLPTTTEWIDAHVVRLVSSLNDLRMTTLNTARPIRALNSAVSALGIPHAEVLAIAAQVSEQASHVSVLFSITDTSEETGYVDFVARCLEP